MIEEVRESIQRTRFRFYNEKDLQRGLEILFQRFGFPYQREVQLDDLGTIDFVISPSGPNPLGIEVKIGGSLSEVTRQLHRYAGSPKLSAIMLVTSRLRHDYMPESMQGKPIYVVPLISGVF